MFFSYWRLLKPFHRTFLFFLGLVILYEAVQVLESYTTSMVIRLFDSQPSVEVWIAFFLAWMLYDELFMRLDNVLDFHIISKHTLSMYRFLKLEAISKFFSMEIAWHQKRNSGTLVGKVANGVEKVNQIIDGLSWEFIPTLVQTILSLIPLMLLSPPAAGLSSAAFVVFAILTLKNHQERKPLKEARYDLYEHEWHRSIEIVQSFETNLMFGATERLLDEQQSLHNRIVDLGTKEARRGLYFYARWQIRVLRFVRRLIWVIWIYQLYTGSLDIPNLIFANVLCERLFYSFWRFNRLIDRTSESAEGAQRLSNLLQEEAKPPYHGNYKGENLKPPLSIELKGVKFLYNQEDSGDNGGLYNLNVEIPAGSVVALVGPSGAGKTTLRKVITGLVPIQGGEILVGGVSIAEWQPERLRAQFSYVPQGDDVFLFNDTVHTNIAFARPEASEDEIFQAARLAGIHQFIEELEEGYDTIVGERGKRLSGGQKQRVALARAILADRPILILDEATSAVDAITEDEIQRQMKTILSGKTAIVIAHRLSTIWDIADKIVVLDRGRKVEEGTHEELVKLGGLYANMAALQTK